MRRTLLGIGLAEGVALLAGEYGSLSPDVPLRQWSVWIGSWLWAPAYVSVIALLPLLLPTGALPSPRWRPAVWLSATAITATSLEWALTPYELQDFPDALADSTNPVGVTAITFVAPAVLGLLALVTAVGAASPPLSPGGARQWEWSGSS